MPMNKVLVGAILLEKKVRDDEEACVTLYLIQVDYGNEFFMVNRAFKAIRRADVVLLMVDVEAGITDQVCATGGELDRLCEALG